MSDVDVDALGEGLPFLGTQRAARGAAAPPGAPAWHPPDVRQRSAAARRASDPTRLDAAAVEPDGAKVPD